LLKTSVKPPVRENLLRKIKALLLALALSALSLPALADEAMIRGLRSNAVLVLDQDSGEILYGKNTHSVLPIASITKLMTAMVTLDADLDPAETLSITKADVDKLKGSRSRLQVGAELSREDMLRLALMASENRAASTLGRTYPGGTGAFVQAMNLKAYLLGMTGTHFADPTGLSSANVSTAEDLAKLANAAQGYAQIREYSTTSAHQVRIGRRMMSFHNTNRLIRNSSWEIGLSKTGYISEAGRCLVMQAKLAGRKVIIVLLDSWGKYTRIADASRIRNWLDPSTAPRHFRKASTIKVRRGNSLNSTLPRAERPA
jgi:serine-type D-Ala-D-Ala endopeptidase (penicillin-binding protein 7)